MEAKNNFFAKIGENRLVQRNPESFKYSEGQKFEQQKAAEEAIKNFKETIENPDQKLNGLNLSESKDPERGMIKTDSVLMLSQIGKKVFPGNKEAADAYTAILLESYEENAPSSLNYGEIDTLNISFNGTSFAVEGLSKGESKIKFEFPKLPKNLEAIQERRDAIKAEAVKQRQLEQIDTTVELALDAAREALNPFTVGKEDPLLSTDKYKAYWTEFGNNPVPQLILFNVNDPFKVKIAKAVKSDEGSWKISKQSPEIEIENIVDTEIHKSLVKESGQAISPEESKTKAKAAKTEAQKKQAEYEDQMADEKLEASEWGEDNEVFALDETIPAGKYKVKRDTKLFGYDPKRPLRYKNLPKESEVEVAENEDVRIVENEKYVKVNIDGKFAGHINITALDIPESYTEYVALATDRMADPQKASLREQVLGDDNIASFRIENGRKDRKLEMKTKLRDMFDSKAGDEIIITRKGRRPKVAVYDESRDNYYYKKADGSFGKRAIFLEGDKVVFQAKNPEREKAKKVPAGTPIYGEFKITKEKQSVHSLMQEIYEKYPDLKEQMEKYGVSESKYFQRISEFRNGDILTILKVKKTEDHLTRDHKAELESRKEAYTSSRAKKAESILAKTQDYLEKDFPIHKSLLDYVNDEEMWNDIWARRNEQGNKYIDGLARVVSILTDSSTFNLSENEVRNGLLQMIQIGYNKHVTFEDVFDAFAKKLYPSGDEEDLVEEIQKHKAVVDKWKTRQDDIKRIENYKERSVQIRAQIATYEAQGLDYTQTDEYKEWEKEKTKLQPIMDEYSKEYQPAAIKFNELTNNILVPCAELLDAIQSMELKTSIDQNFYDQIDEQVALIDISDVELGAHSGYHNLAEMLGQKVDSKETQKFEISISQKAFTEFTMGVSEALGKNKMELNNRMMLQTILKVYSIQTLAAEGCLKREPSDPNKLMLTSLPKSFDFADQRIKTLFGTDANGKFGPNGEKLKALSQVLDNNKVALQKIESIFGYDEELKTHINWLQSFERFFTGEDSREVELTMSAIGNGEVTKPTSEFLQRYMSGDAAKSEVLSSIISVQNGADYYDMNKLQTNLEKSLQLGLETVMILGLKDPEINKLAKAVLGGHGPLNDPKTADKAFNSYRQQLENFILNPHVNLQVDLRETIKIGHVLGRNIEEGKEELVYSRSPEIAAIQKAMMESGKGYTQEDINKVEETLVGGLLLGLGANTDSGGLSAEGMGGGVSFNLGDGWTLSAGAGGSFDGQVGAGVDLSKTVKLSKDGRTALTFGVTAGVLVVGGHVSLKFPISADTDMTVGGAAGWTGGIAFYAVGGIGFRKDPTADIREKFREMREEVGLDKVDKLVAAGASPEQIVDAIVKLPNIGQQFKALRDKYNLSPKGILELYNLKRDQLESNVVKDSSSDGATFEIIGGGVFAGVVNGFPVAGGYIELKLGEETVIVRNEVPGSKNQNELSDEQAQRLIEEKLGRSAEFLETKIADSGNVIFDSSTGKPAVLEGKIQEFDAASIDSFAALDQELRSNINAAISMDPETKLTRIHIKGVKGNLKINIDPAIKEQLVVKDNKILMAMGENPNFTFVRENFYYPFEKEGSTKLTVITIKANPLRKRSQIEKESTHFVYQTPGARPEIRRGIATERLAIDKDQATDITTFAEYQNQSEKAEVRKGDTMKKYEEFIKAREGLVKPEGELREGIIPEESKGESFAETFYKKFHKKYKEALTIGSSKYNPEQLVQDIQKFAETYEIGGQKLGKINDIELREVMTYLNVRGFSNARNKPEKLKANLRYAERKLGKYFGEVIQNMPEGKKPKFTAAEIAAYMIEDLRDTDFNGEKAKLPEGSRLLSIVGTEGIHGLRGVLSEGEKIKTGILNFHEYKLGTPGIRGEIARVILETNSPLETKENAEFMKSQLALKMAAHSGLGFAIGFDEAIKVVEAFKSGKVDDSNKEAFEKFKDMVIQIRENQLQGRNFMELENGVRIQVDTMVGNGAYEGCANATMAIDEDIAILVPKPGATAVSVSNYHRVTAKAQRRDISIVLGIKARFFGDAPEKIPDAKPADKDPEIPDAKDGNKTTGAGNGGLVEPGSTGEIDTPSIPQGPAEPGQGSGRPIKPGQTGETG